MALAVQLIRQPHLLLLDEPTAGLDWSMRRQLVNLLAKLKEHWTLLVVTHDAGDLLPIADSCWTLNHGELESIDPEKLKKKVEESEAAVQETRSGLAQTTSKLTAKTRNDFLVVQ